MCFRIGRRAFPQSAHLLAMENAVRYILAFAVRIFPKPRAIAYPDRTRLRAHRAQFSAHDFRCPAFRNFRRFEKEMLAAWEGQNENRPAGVQNKKLPAA